MLKKISKFQILGIINFLLVIFLGCMVFGQLFNSLHQFSINIIIYQYLPSLVFLLALGFNVCLAYQLLWRHYNPTRFKLYLVVTFLTVFWWIWLFIGVFFAAEATYSAVSFVLIIGIFFFIKKLSVKVALLASAVTVLVVGITVGFGFEEDYCWKKGDEMAVDKPATITIPGQEARQVMPGGNNILVSKAGTSEVGTAAYYHFKCHEDFDFSKALKEKYLFLK